MKFSDLQSIGHNIADSFAGGIGLLIGVYVMDVFTEAQKSREGCITVDFLSGTSAGGQPSPSLARAMVLYRDALTDLCVKHGTETSVFRQLTARYSADAQGKRFVVTVEDRYGRLSIDEYVGLPGKRVKVLDDRGRVRTDGNPFPPPPGRSARTEESRGALRQIVRL